MNDDPFGKLAKKATKIEVNRRVCHVIELLDKYDERTVLNKIQSEFGVQERAAWHILKKAKIEAADELMSTPKSVFIKQKLAQLELIIETTGSDNAKIRAIEATIKLLGLQQPKSEPFIAISTQLTQNDDSHVVYVDDMLTDPDERAKLLESSQDD